MLSDFCRAQSAREPGRYGLGIHRESAAIAAAPVRPRGQPAAANASATARPRDEKTAYAVQLLWSVQPIDIAQIPQLAIFSAYTLYGAEGNRDGRRWYGVRLGFFTDAVSAKQVAHYVRSDFSTVSVVPVTVRERERAKLAAARPDATPLAAASPAAAAPSAADAPVGETKAGQAAFEFIDDKQPAPSIRGGAERRCARRTRLARCARQARQAAHWHDRSMPVPRASP